MEAFAQDEKSHTMQVEIVAASWTFAQSDKKSDNN
jgi:hypothetical protein